MFGFIHRFFGAPHPLDHENLGDEVRDISFRLMEDQDLQTCHSLFRQFFPETRFDQYSKNLCQRKFLTLMAVKNGQTVGSCGVHTMMSKDNRKVAVFCVDMLDVAHQRKGIGTAQVLVRIAALKTVDDLAIAGVVTDYDKRPFYHRFGFVFDREVSCTDSELRPLGLLKMSQSFINDCRAVLAERNITYPDIRDKIPHINESGS
jgi:predicted N-acetyltransferase YhbS